MNILPSIRTLCLDLYSVRVLLALGPLYCIVTVWWVCLSVRELRSSGNEEDVALAQTIKDSYINRVRVATQVMSGGSGWGWSR